MQRQATLLIASLLVPAGTGAAQAPVDTTRVVPNENRVAAGRLTGGALHVQLVARLGLWRPEGPRGPQIPVYAFAEEGTATRSPRIPGPLIRVPLGTEIRASIRNMLPQPMRVYGLQDRPSAGLDSIQLLPGERREVRFRANAAGTYLYWARTSRDTFPFGLIEDGQLAGAIVVDSTPTPSRDRVWVLTLWKARETPPGTPIEEREETLVFNGLSWPHSERLTHTVGDSIRWRVINATRRSHPMHLHGFYYRVDSRGSATQDTVYSPAQRRLAVTERLVPGSSMSMTWSPHTPGNWLFHCHLVEHISARVVPPGRDNGGASHQHGAHEMSGLVLGIVVKPKPGAAAAHEPTPRRRLRLFATERPRIFGRASAFSFVLQEGDREPARDSLRIPGSPIVLTRGEPTSIMVVNRMSEPVTVHWHGIELESYYDGVANWSGIGSRVAPAIAPGDSFDVRLTPDRAGTFIYHTHQRETGQLGAGLFGPLLIVEPGQVIDTLTDRVLLMGAGGPHPSAPPTLNGEVDPRPLDLRAGTTYRLRFINITAFDNKFVRLLADTSVQRWRAVAKDGADLPQHQATILPARLVMGAGETWDVDFTPARAGDLTLEIVSTGRVALPSVLTKVLVRVRE
jgi:manganese oxidase